MSGDDGAKSSGRIFLCLMFAAGTASSQPVPASPEQTPEARMSVEQAVATALAQNLSLQAELERIGIAEGQLRQAGLIPNPIVTANAASDRLFANEGEGGRSAGIEQELETAGKRRYRTLVARNDLERIRQETESTRRDLIVRTQQSYFVLVQAQRNVTLARETSAILRRFVDLNAERVKVGEAPGVELNLARIELARSERNEQEFARLARQAGARLNLLMGRPAHAPIVPTSDFAAPLSLPPEQELVDYALQHRPEVLAAAGNVAAREAALRLARSFRFPNVSLGPSYQTQSTVIGGAPPVPGQQNEFLRRDRQLAFQATVPLPLFNRNQGNIVGAEYERRAAQENALYTRNVVANEIDVALGNYESHLRTRALYEQSVLPQLQRNVEAIQEAYRLGNESIFAVIQVQRTFFETRREYLQTLLDLEADRIDLERAIGRPLR